MRDDYVVMDSLNILALACIIFMLLAIIFAIIAAMTASTKRYIKSSGVNSKGSWKLVGTNAGALPSYYFFERTLVNNSGQYLSVDGNMITLIGEPATVTFNAPFLMINGLYLNLDSNNNFILETTGKTTYLFDAYNFYLTKSITTDKASILSPSTLLLTEVSNNGLYQPPSAEIGKWILA